MFKKAFNVQCHMYLAVIDFCSLRLNKSATLSKIEIDDWDLMKLQNDLIKTNVKI